MMRLLAFGAVMFALGGFAAGTDTPAPAGMAADPGEFWLASGAAEPARLLTLSVEESGRFPAGSPLPLTCQVTPRGTLSDTRVTMTIVDGAGNTVAEDTLDLPLYAGPNTCRFLWEADGAPGGAYVAHLAAASPNKEAPARARVRIELLRPAELQARLEQLGPKLARLESAAGAAAEEGGRPPYTGMRVGSARYALTRAGQALAAKSWREAAVALERAEASAEAAHAQMAFGRALPVLGPPPAPMTELQARDGGLFAGPRPVYLFGAAVGGHGAADIKALRRFGLNFAVVPVSAADALGAGGEPLPFEGALGAALDAAEAGNLAVLAQLRPDDVGDAVLAAHPEIAARGFIDLTHPVVRQRAHALLALAGPRLAASSIVRAVSLAYEPRFQFESAAVREQFIAHAQTLYPERHAMNQSWRSHLASFADIEVGGAYPEHDYHNKRSFQWDWQEFHQRLAAEFLQEMHEEFQRYAPALPATVTLPHTIFEFGESRTGLDRELLAKALPIVGCTADLTPESELYAYSYPNQSAFCTLMRSFQPDKPVLSTENRIELPADMEPGAAYRYVYGSVWDAVVSGLNGMALPADSPLFTRPEAIEAFAMANLDINRLAPVVHAFQRAPADVGILWSDASKVFDDGDPYLHSARFAYEGASFSGYNVRYVTERQCIGGALDALSVLVIPHTPALRDAAFDAVQAFVENDGTVARVGTPIPYNQNGHSRHVLLRPTGKTVVVRGMNLPTEYLHAMDAVQERGGLAHIPRPINAHGYPLEGVKTRYVEWDGGLYLFVLNMRAEPVECHLAGNMQQGRDLIEDRLVAFPRVLEPLEPMLIRMDSPVVERVVPTRVAGAD